MDINYKRLAYFIVAVVAATLGSIYGQPLIHGNKDASMVIVNVFAILAGFLIALMTLLSNPRDYGDGNWRKVKILEHNVYRKLSRQRDLFIIYLFVLGMIFSTMLVSSKHPEHQIIIAMEYIYLGLAIFAFILSFSLPFKLMDIQMERASEDVESRQESEKKTHKDFFDRG